LGEADKGKEKGIDGFNPIRGADSGTIEGKSLKFTAVNGRKEEREKKTVCLKEGSCLKEGGSIIRRENFPTSHRGGALSFSPDNRAQEGVKT